MAAGEDSPEQTAEVLRYQISTMMGAVQNSIPLQSVESFVAVGGDARFAVRQIGRPTDSPELFRIDPAEFDQLVARCEHYTAEELAKRFGVPFAEAETIIPALLGLPEPVPPDQGLRRSSSRTPRCATGCCWSLPTT